MNWKKKHKELEEQYEHYTCGRCMEIGANEVISEFLEDLKKSHNHCLDQNKYEHYYGTIANWQFIFLIEKWKKRKNAIYKKEISSET